MQSTEMFTIDASGGEGIEEAKFKTKYTMGISAYSWIGGVRDRNDLILHVACARSRNRLRNERAEVLQRDGR